ncbi:homeobox protein Nkx-2.5-like [Zophobas morio]|uniref:homeobox protein Nkx-2.5-like n=1 Tax=Zophobas morio TaxID=2755281 RepID=UPI0030828442
MSESKEYLRRTRNLKQEDVKEEPPDQNSKKKKEKTKPTHKSPRSNFSKDQLDILEAAFRTKKYIKSKQRDDLSQATGLTENQVTHWFQKRRYKEKKKITKEQKLEEKWNKYLLELIESSVAVPFLELLEYVDNYSIQRDYFVNNSSLQQANGFVCPHEYYHGTLLKCPCASSAPSGTH